MKEKHKLFKKLGINSIEELDDAVLIKFKEILKKVTEQQIKICL